MQLLTTLLPAMTSIEVHGTQVQIPDPLVLPDGKKITTVKQWQKEQRLRLLELFRSEVYGRTPVERPRNLKFEVKSVDPTALDGFATLKRVEIVIGGKGAKKNDKIVIQLSLFIPNNAKKPVPTFVLLNNRGSSTPEQALNKPFWPVTEIVKRGYATGAIMVANIDPDKDDGFKNGVHGLFDGEKPRSPDAWGTIAAWAWGASRVMDYLEIDKAIDSNHVAVIGHSRGGKTALWAGAQDQRFAMVFSNDSGSTGAALARNKTGENIATINKTFPHWFNENYKNYNDRESELPVDQHELCALIAPRLLYVASATEDATADPHAEFASAVAASPVYGLFGLKGLVADGFPTPDTPLQEGNIGYHLRTGEHDLTNYDWKNYMDFVDKHWGSREAI